MNPRVFHSLDEARGSFGPCALAIGNFDGVHLGHQALIRETLGCARARGLRAAVLTFDPHPTAVVAPARVPPLICNVEERLRLIGRAGAEHIFVLNFNAEIARLLPEEFVAKILVEALDTKAVFVGDNFRFGHKQAGTPEVFRELGSRYGFSTRFLTPVEFRGEVICSTAVRQAIRDGDVIRAARLLGRCYSTSGPVVSGRGIGSKQTVPTLNLRPQPELITPHGIFVTETFEPESGRRWPSVTSCGYNPTFGATELTIETYLLSKLEGRTPEAIRVDFRHYLRDEEHYASAEALRTQIIKDVSRSEAYWRHANRLRLHAAQSLPSASPSIY